MNQLRASQRCRGSLLQSSLAEPGVHFAVHGQRAGPRQFSVVLCGSARTKVRIPCATPSPAMLGVAVVAELDTSKVPSKKEIYITHLDLLRKDMFFFTLKLRLIQRSSYCIIDHTTPALNIQSVVGLHVAWCRSQLQLCFASIAILSWIRHHNPRHSIRQRR